MNNREHQRRSWDVTEWDVARKDLKNVYIKRQVPAVLLAYLEDDQSKCVDVCLRRGYRVIPAILLRYHEFWSHKRHGVTV